MREHRVKCSRWNGKRKTGAEENSVFLALSVERKGKTSFPGQRGGGETSTDNQNSSEVSYQTEHKARSSLIVTSTNIFVIHNVTNIIVCTYTLLLFLFVFFFYKNILFSSMIVFLISNKISSFGIWDGEEEVEEEK